MSEHIVTESKDDTDKIINGKRKIEERVKGGHNSAPEKPVKRICLRFTKPSYFPRLKNVRTENRGRLNHLIRILMRQHNWKESSGTLSVLLKGTCKEASPMKNRVKYWVAMELLNRIDNDHINLAKIKHIYEIWMRKNRSMKNRPTKDRYVIQLEYVLFCLTKGNIEEAHQAIICLMQENEYGRDPTLNLMVGLIFYQLWYSTVPKEMKLRDSDKYDTPTLLEMSGTWSINPVDNSDCHEAVDMHEVDSPARCDSNTSVRNDKEIHVDAGDDNQKKHSDKKFQPRGFYIDESAEMNGDEEALFSNYGGNLMHSSIFYARGLDTYLLPIRLPHLNEKLEEFIYLHREMLNDYYASAVEHLRFALYSTPSILAALLPLMQLLLLGDHVNEALRELEKLCLNSNTTLPLRLRASILESFDRSHSLVLSSCYEDILKKDPTCDHSLSKLITMHKNGDYSLEPLLEMIALHLDSVCVACYDTWGELASCFLKLSHYEEDQISICGNENKGGRKQGFSARSNMIPKVFIEGNSRMSWMLRCKWWPIRHFSKKAYDSEMQAGELQLLTFKAACASHMYGPDFGYVTGVYTCLEKEETKDRILFLQMHIKNSIKFHENLNR